MIKIYKIAVPEYTNTCIDYSIEYIAPINGMLLNAIDFFLLAKDRYNINGKLNTPGEIGCTLSHMEIYKKIIETGLPAIILESDIQPSNDELATASAIIKRADVDFIHLGWHPSIIRGVYFKGQYLKEKGLYKINPNVNFHGTYSYYITPKCAKELLKFNEKILRPADSWAIFFNQTTITPYFYPVFTHPIDRGDIQKQRVDISQNVFAITKENIAFYVRKKAAKLFSHFRPYKNITPIEHKKNTKFFDKY